MRPLRTNAPTVAAYAALVALTVGTLRSFTGCSRKSPEVQEPADVGPAPPPAGLMAEVFVPRPSATYAALLRAMAGSAGLLPRSPALLLGSAWELPLQSVEELDLDLPAFGGVIDDGTGVSAAIALHVKDGPRFTHLATTGASARYTARADPTSGVTFLTRKEAREGRPAFLIARNYLVVGSREAAALALAPFMTRTLPERPRPEPEEDAVVVVPKPALAESWPRNLTNWWAAWRRERETDDLAMRKRHGASMPDFGDATEALADIDGRIGRLVEFVGALDEARATLAVDPKAIHVRIAMKADDKGGPAGRALAGMTVGDASPLLELPASAVLAVLSRDSGETRAAAAKEQGEALARVLSGRLRVADRALIERTLSTWASARGDWISAGAMGTPGGALTAFYRSPVAEPGRAREGIAQLSRLVSIPALKTPMNTWLGELTAAPAAAGDTRASDEVRVFHATRRPPKLRPAGFDASAEAEPFDVAWSMDGRLLVCTAGKDAVVAHRALTHGNETDALGRDPEASAMLRATGSQASFVLLLEPLKLAGAPNGPSAPLVFAFGRGDGRGWARLDVSPTAAQAYVRSK